MAEAPLLAGGGAGFDPPKGVTAGAVERLPIFPPPGGLGADEGAPRKLPLPPDEPPFPSIKGLLASCSIFVCRNFAPLEISLSKAVRPGWAFTAGGKLGAGGGGGGGMLNNYYPRIT